MHNCTHKETGKEVVTIIKRANRINDELHDKLEYQFNCMMQLEHPNIVKAHALFEI
jgi:hypothetical protein